MACVCVVCRRNILETQNATYLKSCHYNSQSDVDRLCPIFTLGDIVNETQSSPNDTYRTIALHVCNLRFIHTADALRRRAAPNAPATLQCATKCRTIYIILLAEGLQRAEMHHRAKFRQNSSVRCRVIAIFQDGGCLPSWICLGHIWTTHEGYFVVIITVQNLQSMQ